MQGVGPHVAQIVSCRSYYLSEVSLCCPQNDPLLLTTLLPHHACLFLWHYTCKESCYFSIPFPHCVLLSVSLSLLPFASLFSSAAMLPPWHSSLPWQLLLRVFLCSLAYPKILSPRGTLLLLQLVKREGVPKGSWGKPHHWWRLLLFEKEDHSRTCELNFSHLLTRTLERPYQPPHLGWISLSLFFLKGICILSLQSGFISFGLLFPQTIASQSSSWRPWYLEASGNDTKYIMLWHSCHFWVQRPSENPEIAVWGTRWGAHFSQHVVFMCCSSAHCVEPPATAGRLALVLPQRVACNAPGHHNTHFS